MIVWVAVALGSPEAVLEGIDVPPGTQVEISDRGGVWRVVVTATRMRAIDVMPPVTADDRRAIVALVESLLVDLQPDALPAHVPELPAPVPTPARTMPPEPAGERARIPAAAPEVRGGALLPWAGVWTAGTDPAAATPAPARPEPDASGEAEAPTDAIAAPTADRPAERATRAPVVFPEEPVAARSGPSGSSTRPSGSTGPGVPLRKLPTPAGTGATRPPRGSSRSRAAERSRSSDGAHPDRPAPAGAMPAGAPPVGEAPVDVLAGAASGGGAPVAAEPIEALFGAPSGGPLDTPAGGPPSPAASTPNRRRNARERETEPEPTGLGPGPGSDRVALPARRPVRPLPIASWLAADVALHPVMPMSIGGAFGVTVALRDRLRAGLAVAVHPRRIVPVAPDAGFAEARGALELVAAPVDWLSVRAGSGVVVRDYTQGGSRVGRAATPFASVGAEIRWHGGPWALAVGGAVDGDLARTVFFDADTEVGLFPISARPIVRVEFGQIFRTPEGGADIGETGTRHERGARFPAERG